MPIDNAHTITFFKKRIYTTMLVVRQTMSLRDFPRLSAEVNMADLHQATHISGPILLSIVVLTNFLTWLIFADSLYRVVGM